MSRDRVDETMRNVIGEVSNRPTGGGSDPTESQPPELSDTGTTARPKVFLDTHNLPENIRTKLVDVTHADKDLILLPLPQRRRRYLSWHYRSVPVGRLVSET